MQIKPSLYKTLTAEEIHKRQYKRRTRANIYLGLIGTSTWGILETTILRIVAKIEHFWPQLHNRFMKLMHGLFGSVVTPFEIAFERNPSKRTFETRSPVERISNDKIFLKKGEMVILPNEEVLQLLLRSNARKTISYCFCRSFMKEQGNPCPKSAPIRTCLTLSLPQPIDSLVQKEPRKDLVENEKIWYDLFKKCDDLGLVHQAIWIPSPNYTYTICNCCDCCCEVLRSRIEMKKEIQYHKIQLKLQNNKKKSLLKQNNPKELRKSMNDIEKRIEYHKKGASMELSPIVARSAFVAKQVRHIECLNCGICEERCYFDARQIHHGKLHYDPDMCYGCGLCVSKCPQNMIELVRRKKSVLLGKDAKNPIKHIHPHYSH